MDYLTFSGSQGSRCDPRVSVRPLSRGLGVEIRRDDDPPPLSHSVTDVLQGFRTLAPGPSRTGYPSGRNRPSRVEETPQIVPGLLRRERVEVGRDEERRHLSNPERLPGGNRDYGREDRTNSRPSSLSG